MLFQLFSVSRRRLKLLLQLARTRGRGSGNRREELREGARVALFTPFRPLENGDALRGVNLVVFPTDVPTDRCSLSGENNGVCVCVELRKKEGRKRIHDKERYLGALPSVRPSPIMHFSATKPAALSHARISLLYV